MKIEDDVLDELISLIKTHMSDSQIIPTFCDMRDSSEDEEMKSYFQNVLDELCEDNKFCPVCGIRLIPNIYREYHNELDENSYEEMIKNYTCECCGKIYEEY